VTARPKMASLTPLAESGPLPQLGDSLGFLICDTARYVKRVLYARLAPYGIPGGCWFVLRALWQQDGVSQRELSATLGLAEPALMMTLRTLERLGLVARERDPADRRRMFVNLTARAQGLKKELLNVASDVNQSMHAAMSEAQRQAMMSGLASVHEQLASTCVDVVAPSAEPATNKSSSGAVSMLRPRPTLVRSSQIRARAAAASSKKVN
jgi:DNA-binding MarR family transcriptional regulator